ncbi:SDR family NAD(P)-dependent oxidoreductase [Candidatus Erwinia haradaeae]|uniref:Protein YeeZ n=1 Tax=Candidatus Erwinia haradaeae TaxID=1922217 RepID=A0A451DP85_9GAMM|nr:SDR family NAD(P)-dependent oxidoreductase [Candidatus Erwinia haradaeae]VFP88611.1 Protein YeeZ [Candidatus Erwinia haradaeae]
MKRVAIIGLGWLGLPLGMSLIERSWQVSGSKTTQDGVELIRMSGINSYLLKLTPKLMCNKQDLKNLLNVDAMVITLPLTQKITSNTQSSDYLLAIQNLVNVALNFSITQIIFTSSISVYEKSSCSINENTTVKPHSFTARVLLEVENWLSCLKMVSVDILRLAGLVGPKRHPGTFLVGKTVLKNGYHGVNLVHLDDVVAAIILLLSRSSGGNIYNLSAPEHPARNKFYPQAAKKLGLPPPSFYFNVNDSREFGRIIDGSKICRDLGFVYCYPDPMCMIA